MKEKEKLVVVQNTIEGKTGQWESRIGLEVHAQIQSDKKLFSGSFVQQATLANSQISPVDIALPGALPVLNYACVAQAIKTSLALNSNINKTSRFDRKHYYYHDLPLGFQITQFFNPIAEGGYLTIELPEEQPKSIKITRIQMEIDSGKSLHGEHRDYTMVDFNRAGVPLLEIITDPDLNTSLEACEFIKKITYLLMHIGVCLSEVGGEGLRCDANISVKRVGEEKLGTRCEVKNLNSVRALRDAIEYESRRQIELIENGEQFGVETRWWDPEKKITYLARKKDEMLDYRFMPEPDLPPILLTNALIQEVSSTLPELPEATKERLQRDYGISSYFADIICSEFSAAQYFEQSVKLYGESNQNPFIAHWLVNELLFYVKEMRLNVGNLGVTPSKFISILKLVDREEITAVSAKKIIAEIVKGSTSSVDEIVNQLDCRIQKLSDEYLLEECKKVLDRSKDEVEKYKIPGKEDRMMRHFVGEMMKLTKGKGDSKKIQKIFSELLK